MSWNILPKNVLQYFLTKLKGLMYTKTEVDNLIPSITPNPSTTTGVLNGLEIDGTAYEIRGTGEPNVQADWNEVDSTADDYIKNKPSLATVATSGSYNDLSNKPTIPDISTKVSKSGDTMSGTLYFSNYNDVAICLNSNGPNYKTTFSHQSAGQEATVIATKFENTSFIFINGEDSITNHANNRWQSLTPALQIKKNSVAIGKLIGQGVDPSYTLEVEGTTRISGNTKIANGLFVYGRAAGGGDDEGIVVDTFSNNYAGVCLGKPTGRRSVFYLNSSKAFWRYTPNGSNIYDIDHPAKSGTIALTSDLPGNNAVTQTDTTGNGNYRVLYSATADDTTRTEGARKGRIYFNPSNGMFWASNGSNQFQIGNNYLYLNGKITLIQAGNQQLTMSATTSASGETNYRVALGVYNNSWTFKPFTDKTLTLGQSSERWGQIYSSNSAISTSDRKEKKDIVSLDEFARTLIMSLNPVSYKFKDGNSGRTHYGMIAQDVEDSLEELGITPKDIAAFCKDKKLKDIPVFSGQRDSNGNPIYDKKQVPIPGEFTYGLRYEEFIAPLIKTVQLQQQEIEELKHRIDILEGK